MANPYTPPGVYVTETISPNVSPLLASPADVCLIGTPAGFQAPLTTTDTINLTGTTPHVLPTIAAINNDAVLVSVLSVKDVLNPSVGTPAGAGYTVTTDYTVNAGEGPPDGSHATISRVGAGSITDGRLVSVTYTYTPVDYFNPIRLFDIASVEARFGPAWSTATNSSGQTVFTGVNSQLSMAARLAFENGADSVICQPLFTLDGGGNQIAPNSTQAADASTWQKTLQILRPIQNLDIIVPVIGQDGNNVNDAAMLSIFAAVQGHIAYMNAQQQFIVGVFGEDGTASQSEFQGLLTTVPNTHAPSLQSNYGNALSSQCVLINNTVFQRAVPGLQSGTINVGGQYCAAAVAGALAGRSVSASLTRQPILGFASITDPRDPSTKNSDAGSGLFVVEQIGQVVRCRQAITLDIAGGPGRAELSVVRAKHLLIESIRQTLDNQIIGQIIADANSPLIVRSAISSVLTLLQQAGSIVDYTPVTATLVSLQPTTINASFSYQPAFPVNFINVSFSLDLTSGIVSVDATGNAV